VRTDWQIPSVDHPSFAHVTLEEPPGLVQKKVFSTLVRKCDHLDEHILIFATDYPVNFNAFGLLVLTENGFHR